MPKKKGKTKVSLKLPKGFIEIEFYGIWSQDEKKLVFASLDLEMTKTEFDLEGYDDQFVLVHLKTVIDINNLG